MSFFVSESIKKIISKDVFNETYKEQSEDTDTIITPYEKKDELQGLVFKIYKKIFIIQEIEFSSHDLLLTLYCDDLNLPIFFNLTNKNENITISCNNNILKTDIENLMIKTINKNSLRNCYNVTILIECKK